MNKYKESKDAYREAHREEHKLYMKEYNKRRYLLNKEKCNKTSTEWNRANRDKANSYIKNWKSKNQAKLNSYEAKRRASKLQQTPKWADLKAIEEFYMNCPKGYHVDHIVPLNGKMARGLHILENLQYLLGSENCRKGNR